jgi:phenylpropionate dioxygenase-like ring-hydroxylating dioxygenase large terminal subunit
MLTKELNDLLSHVGPGTPGGEFMRRYWHPVSLSRDVTPGGKPKQVRILSEDLVLFRDDAGRPGLLGLHCSHRLTSLGYGRVEDGGIRCPFHGWLYDVEGWCLEQPAEPDGSTLKERVRHLSYPCQDSGGLVFAYLGPPEQMPLLPRYEVLTRTDGTRQCTWWPINGSYLQHLEGAWDWIHAGYLHTNNWSTKKHVMAATAKPEVELTETEFGLRRRSEQFHPGGERGLTYGYFFMPAGWLRLNRNWARGQVRIDTVIQDDVQKFQAWFVPVDDGHTLRYQVAFAPFNSDGSPYPWRGDGQLMQPGADEDYGRDYDNVDTISGIDPSTAPTFRAQDTMANETQGFPFMDRSLEHLGAHDFILTAMRMMMLKGIADVEKGLDPKHIIRDPAQNEMVFIRGDDELEMFTAERPKAGAGLG